MNPKLCNWMILLVIILLIVIAYHIYLITNAVVAEDFVSSNGIEYDKFPNKDTPGDDIGCYTYKTSYDLKTSSVNKDMNSLRRYALQRASKMTNVNAVNIFRVITKDNRKRTFLRYMYCLKNTKKTPTPFSGNNIRGLTLFMKKKEVFDFEGVYPTGNKLPNTVYMNLLVRGRATISKHRDGKNTLIASVNNKLFNKRITDFLPTDKLLIRLTNSNNGKNYIIGNWFYNGKEYQTSSKTLTVDKYYSVGKRLGYYANVGNRSVLPLTINRNIINIEDCGSSTSGNKYYGFNNGKCVFSKREPTGQPVSGGINYAKYKLGNQYRGGVDNKNVQYTDVYVREIPPNIREGIVNINELSKHFNKEQIDRLDIAKVQAINIEIGPDSSMLHKVGSSNTFVISMPEAEDVTIKPIEFCPNADYNLFDGYGCVDATSEGSCINTVVAPYKANKELCTNKWENILYIKPSTSTDIQQIDDNILNRIIESMKLVYSRSTSQSGNWSCIPEPNTNKVLSVRFNNRGNIECAASNTGGIASCNKNSSCPSSVSASTVIECSDYNKGSWCNQGLTQLKSTQRYDGTFKKLILDTWEQGYELLKFKPDEAAAVPYKKYTSFEQAMSDSSFTTSFILLIKRVNGICETSGKAQTGCQTMFRQNMVQLAKLTNLIKVNK